MRCPKCGDKNVYIFVDDIHTGDAWWVCPSMCCDWRKPYLHPAVKLAFAAYERALTMTWQHANALDAYRDALPSPEHRKAMDTDGWRAWGAAKAARTSRRKAEGKEDAP